MFIAHFVHSLSKATNWKISDLFVFIHIYSQGVLYVIIDFNF